LQSKAKKEAKSIEAEKKPKASEAAIGA